MQWPAGRCEVPVEEWSRRQRSDGRRSNSSLRIGSHGWCAVRAAFLEEWTDKGMFDELNKGMCDEKPDAFRPYMKLKSWNGPVAIKEEQLHS